MKINNLILGTYLATTAILYSGCGNTSSSNNKSKDEKKDIMDTSQLGSDVIIGSQVWTSKNLDVETYRNGDVIKQVKDNKDWANLTTGAWCYMDNDEITGRTYGKLYNWYAVNDPRGLAPKGYHIPTESECRKLIDCLGEDVGTELKSTASIEGGGWYGYGNIKGTNSSGFSALAGGFRTDIGYFFYSGRYALGFWWSSTEININVARSFDLQSTNQGLGMGSDSKKRGMSVRCLRD